MNNERGTVGTETAEISCVGVIGAGTMGSMIAWRCLLNGMRVSLFDISAQALAEAEDRICAWLAERPGNVAVEEGREDSILARLRACETLRDCVFDVELALEAVPEKLDLKRRVFAAMDCLAPRQAILATNSSSILSSSLADVTDRPDKVLNVHFHHLITRPRAPVEIMGHPLTAARTIAACKRFVRTLGFLPIVVKREIMGFGINTLWREIKRTALRLVDEGCLDFEDIDRGWMLAFDQAKGIFAQMDAIGLDTVRDIEMQYYQASGDERDKPPKLLDEMVDQEHLGVKSGRGFYTYPDPAYERPGWLLKASEWAQREDEHGCESS